MKKLILAAACAALLANVAVADNHAEAEDNVTRAYMEYVKPTMHDEYRAVVSEWNACMAEIDDGMHWHTYRAETGNTNRYVFAVGNLTWAHFDRERPELESCYNQFKDRYYETVDKIYASYDVYMKEHSYHVEDEVDRKIGWVTVFELNDSRAFLENVKKYTEAARENEWKDPYYFYSAIGGEHGSGIYVVSPVASFADFDGDNGFWKMLEDHFGEEEFRKMREIDREAIDDYYADIWVRDDELSAGHDD